MLLQKLLRAIRAREFDLVFTVRSPAQNPFDRSTEKNIVRNKKHSGAGFMKEMPLEGPQDPENIKKIQNVEWEETFASFRAPEIHSIDGQ